MLQDATTIALPCDRIQDRLMQIVGLHTLPYCSAWLLVAPGQARLARFSIHTYSIQGLGRPDDKVEATREASKVLNIHGPIIIMPSIILEGLAVSASPYRTYHALYLPCADFDSASFRSSSASIARDVVTLQYLYKGDGGLR